MTKKKEKTLKLYPLYDNVICRAELKESPIVLPEESGNENRTIEGLFVHAIGEKVKSIKVGDRISVPHQVISTPSFRVDLRVEDPDGIYFQIKEEDIIGIFK